MASGLSPSQGRISGQAASKGSLRVRRYLGFSRDLRCVGRISPAHHSRGSRERNSSRSALPRAIRASRGCDGSQGGLGFTNAVQERSVTKKEFSQRFRFGYEKGMNPPLAAEIRGTPGGSQIPNLRRGTDAIRKAHREIPAHPGDAPQHEGLGGYLAPARAACASTGPQRECPDPPGVLAGQVLGYAAVRVTYDGIQIHGGMGLSDVYPREAFPRRQDVDHPRRDRRYPETGGGTRASGHRFFRIRVNPRLMVSAILPKIV